MLIVCTIAYKYEMRAEILIPRLQKYRELCTTCVAEESIKEHKLLVIRGGEFRILIDVES